MEPVTIDFALAKLDEALKAGDGAEIEKWDMCIRGINDLRIRARKHRSIANEEHLRRELCRSYKLPTPNSN